MQKGYWACLQVWGEAPSRKERGNLKRECTGKTTVRNGGVGPAGAVIIAAEYPSYDLVPWKRGRVRIRCVWQSYHII